MSSAVTLFNELLQKIPKITFSSIQKSCKGSKASTEAVFKRLSGTPILKFAIYANQLS